MCFESAAERVFFRDAIFFPTFGPPRERQKTNTDSDVTTDVLPLLFLSSGSQKVTESIFRPENKAGTAKNRAPPRKPGTLRYTGRTWRALAFHWHPSEHQHITMRRIICTTVYAVVGTPVRRTRIVLNGA